MFNRWLYFASISFVLVKTSADEPRVAIAHLVSNVINGSILFTETSEGLHVTGSITGLPQGNYGFHIHELGDTTTCYTTGAHFNPDETDHGGRDHDVRHVGDFGNVQFVGDPLVATVDFVDHKASLRGRNNIVGRALVLHEQEDDLGQGEHELSLTTGNAGPRVACGVVGIRSPALWNSATIFRPSSVLLALALSFVSLFIGTK